MTDETNLLARIRTGDYLESAKFPPMSWAVPGLIPEGFGLFTGAPKTGKSWAALGIALAVADGEPALGKVPTGYPRPVLLMALEDGERRLQGRCRTLLADGVTIPENLHYIVNCPPSMVLPLIREWLDRYGDENTLIVLDTLGKVMPPALPGEGAYSRDYRIGSALKALVDASPGSTLLVVHHVRKLGSEDWMDSTSGTNGLNGAADFTLNLSRQRNEDSGLLRVTGRDVVEAEYAVTVTDGRWTLDGSELSEAAARAEQARAKTGLGDSSVAILEALAGHPEGVTPKDLAVQLDLDADLVGRYLRRFVESGRATKEGRGTYTPVRSVRVSESIPIIPSGHPDTSDTPTGECLSCGEPLDLILVAEGAVTHPGCEIGR